MKLWIVLAAAVVLLVPTKAASQAPGPTPGPSYEERCGIRVTVPVGWNHGWTRDQRPALWTGEPPQEVQFLILSVRQEFPSGNPSAEAHALSKAGQNCLLCVGDNLKWMDRFSEGSKVVSYTVSQAMPEIQGTRYPYDVWQFFIVDDRFRARGGGWISAESALWVPDGRRREMERTGPDTVRSIEFVDPARFGNCWR